MRAVGRLPAALAAACAVLACTGPDPAPPPTVRHVIAYVEAGDGSHWLVESAFTGVQGTGRVRVRLDDWGEWTQAVSPYLQDLESEPPLVRDPERATDLVIRVPTGWDGSLQIRYRIETMPQAAGHTLLPYRANGYSLGFRRNTLMRLVAGDTTVAVDERLSLVPPNGWEAVTDLGLGAPGNPIRLLGDNTSIVFGRPTDHTVDTTGPRPVSCWQFGGDEPVCAAVAEAAARLLDAFDDLPYVRGSAPPETLTVLIPEGRRGGTGGFGGIILGYNANMTDHPLPYNITTLLAHELLHAFVPVVTSGENTAVWFHEGFTEYLALWHVVKAGLVSPTTFASLLEAKAAAVAAGPAGDVRLADPLVRWREGPNEDFAYNAGAIAAFALDAESRLRGGGGVTALLRYLHGLGDAAPTFATVASWLSDAGLEELRRHVFEGVERYDVGAGLRRMGFTVGRRDALLVYTGIETDRGFDAGRVVRIDPDGPAARTALRIGDVIEGYEPRVTAPITVSDEYQATTTYLFGVNRLARGGCCTLHVRRDAARVVIRIDPWSSRGGWQHGLTAEREAVAPFFRHTTGIR